MIDLSEVYKKIKVKIHIKKSTIIRNKYKNQYKSHLINIDVMEKIIIHIYKIIAQIIKHINIKKIIQEHSEINKILQNVIITKL